MLSPLVIRNSVLRKMASSCLPITPHLKLICRYDYSSDARLLYSLLPNSNSPAFRMVCSSYNLAPYSAKAYSLSAKRPCRSQIVIIYSITVSNKWPEDLFSRVYLRSATSKKASNSSLNRLYLTCCINRESDAPLLSEACLAIDAV
jgi:hypothetical protein